MEMEQEIAARSLTPRYYQKLSTAVETGAYTGEERREGRCAGRRSSFEQLGKIVAEEELLLQKRTRSDFLHQKELCPTEAQIMTWSNPSSSTLL